jgi:predicted ArsR family transcriptional regulator
MKRTSRALDHRDAIAALASPVRQELFDVLEAVGGETTVAELANHLGRAADGLYYHLETMRRVGLIDVVAGRSRAGRDERRYRLVGGDARLELGPSPGNPSRARAVGRVVGGMLRIARRNYDSAVADGACSVGAARDLWAARQVAWVTRKELADINRLLATLVTHMPRTRTSRRTKLISLCVVLAPLQPTRRARRASGSLTGSGRRS